jgi:hypothetical protein
MDRPPAPAELDRVEALIESWLEAESADNEAIAAYERDSENPRLWHIRMLGEAKDSFTVRFRLGQRSLAYETYLMPAPEENQQAFYEHLLRRNLRIVGGAFAIGEEDAVFLVGQIPVAWLDENELDRIVGSLYQWVEQFFEPALRIGFARHFSK